MATSLAVSSGRRIQKLREAKGWNQEYLSAVSGVGRAHLSQIENGAVSPRIDTIQAIAQSFGISMSEFFKNLGID